MTPEQRKAWLLERRTGIGGSDAAASVGLSKWKTPIELWLDKRGELPDRQTEPMKWGTLLEPVVRQEYANRTGRSVMVPGRILRHATVSFAILTTDGIADGSRLYEGKTARTDEGWGEPGSADVPQDYMLQVQHGLFVTGLAVCDVAVLVGGSDFRLYEVPADRELQALLIDRERDFWRHVETNTPPEPINREDVKRRWRFSNGKQCQGADVDAGRALYLARCKALIKALEDEEKSATADLQGIMRDAGELLAPGGEVLATWNNTAGAERFDVERFKEEHPDLYRSYLKTAAGSRRFCLKLKGSDPWSPETLTQLLSSPSLPKIAAPAGTAPSPSPPKASGQSQSSNESRRKSKAV